MIPKFRKGVRVPAVDEYVQGENHYKRICDNEHRMLYEVTAPIGAKYYEVVEHGHFYKAPDGWFKSKTIMDGEEMYPMDEDFGCWAWCFSKIEDAKRCYNYHSPEAESVE